MAGISLLDIVSDCGEWKLGAVSSTGRVSIFVGDGAGTAIGTSQAVETNDKKPGDIKGLTWASHQGTPPISDVGTAAEGMTYDEDIVFVLRQLTAGGVGDRYVDQGDAGFEGKGGDDGKVLFRDQLRKGVFWLGWSTLYGI